MRQLHTRLPAALLAAALLAACGESDSPAGPAAAPSLRESDLVATWKMDQPAFGDTVKITMAVSADHTMLVSINSGIQGGDGSRMRADVRREAMQWSLAGNKWVSSKTACEYLDDATGKLKAGDCLVPVQETAQVALNGKTLTVMKGDVTYYFTKD